MVDAHGSDEEAQDKTFIEEPAILDKYKASALIADCKYRNPFTDELHKILTCL